jgi:protein-tyrosine-phosphatase
MPIPIPGEGSAMKVAFVCVQNAGRSQMATAFAERERDTRGVDIELVTGGTMPADHVHASVETAMAEQGFDLSDRTPREVTPDELADCDVVVTMGCSAEDVCPATFTGENRDWGLDDPDALDMPGVRRVRDDIERRVVALFDELEPEPTQA